MTSLRLTDSQIEFFFHKNGFVWMDAITVPEEIEKLKVVYDRMFKDRTGREKGEHFDLAGPDDEGKEPILPQILYPRQHAPEFSNHLRGKCFGDSEATARSRSQILI